MQEEEAPATMKPNLPALTRLRTKTDLFIERQVDGIPCTTPRRAIWLFSQDKNKFVPHCWGNLELSPKLEQMGGIREEREGEFDGEDAESVESKRKAHKLLKTSGGLASLVDSLGESLPKLPRALYCQLTTLYFFIVHCPLMYFLTLYFFNHIGGLEELETGDGETENPEKEEIRWVTLKYLFSVLFMTCILVTLYFILRNRYKNLLTRRVKVLDKLLDDINDWWAQSPVYLRAGPFGTFLEAKFISEDSVMIEKVRGERVDPDGSQHSLLE